LIDLGDRNSWASRRPLLVAHRAGIVGLGSPENSVAAIQGAAARGYDLVEIDARPSKDGVPVLFHGDWTQTLRLTCGVDRRVDEMTAAEIRALTYRKTDQHVIGLDEALALCAELRLGVMLDIKVEPSGPAFVDAIAALLEEHAMTRAAMTISRDPIVVSGLADRVLQRATAAEIARASPPMTFGAWPTTVSTFTMMSSTNEHDVEGSARVEIALSRYIGVGRLPRCVL
jgi:glycerophosphoryl diester phosphodiesterase